MSRKTDKTEGSATPLLPYSDLDDLSRRIEAYAQAQWALGHAYVNGGKPTTEQTRASLNTSRHVFEWLARHGYSLLRATPEERQ